MVKSPTMSGFMDFSVDFNEHVSLDCDLLWYNRKDIWSLSMVPSQDFLKPLDFLSGEGDRSILCSKEVIVCWSLDSFRMGVSHQEDQAWIWRL